MFNDHIIMSELQAKLNSIFEAINKKNLYSEFYSIATEILTSYCLVIDDKPHNIVEIEFYLNAGNHEDMFTHKHEGYCTGQFRLHGAGIDIALGEEHAKGHGGILLRSISVDDEILEGPWKVAEYLVKHMGNIGGTSIAMKKKENSGVTNVFSAPRVGLQLKKNESLKKQAPYLLKNYRFFTEHVLQKEKYVIGLMHHINKTSIAGKWNKATFDSYKKEYEMGMHHKADGNGVKDFDKITDSVKAYLIGYFSEEVSG